MSQKKYNQEFKQTVVELYRSGSAVSQLSSEYGVSEVTIYKKASGGAWKRGLEQDFKTETIKQKWVADILYIHTVRDVYRTRYDGFETVRIALYKYIEGWYNRKRIHGSIGYLTPDAFEKMCRAAAWK